MDSIEDISIIKIETFDLIGFRGSEFVSSMISYLQKKALSHRYKKHENIPEISHVGLAVCGKDMNLFTQNILKKFKNKIIDEEIYVFESTASGVMLDQVRDVFGNFHFGVQLRGLKDLQARYPGKIYWSSKLFNVNKKHFRRLSEFIRDTNYKPYETSMPTMLSNVFRCIKAVETPDSYFCSELVTKSLQHSGILSTSVNPERVVPLDFYKDPRQPNRTLDVDGEMPVLYANPIRFN